MVRPRKLVRRKRDRNGNSYEKMMKTLLLQNQQIIIQQQNMMFMVIKQLQHSPNNGQTQPLQQQTHQQPIHNHHHQQLQPQQSQHIHLHEDQQSIPTHQLFSQVSTSSIVETQQQLQQVANQLQENLGNYLTPAASEQDPINDKQEDDDLAALLEGDGLLPNNLLYNPQTDIGSITPYKGHHQPQQTSYYSSGCESLTTPRVVEQRQPSTSNISQNVVKNLADSFKSPSKPKINVQIMSGSATGSMKNSKAKIIQRMNISEFLRHVHPDTDEHQKAAT